MRLHYEVQGQGFPLIILHGLFGSLDNWRTQSKGLGRFFKIYVGGSLGVGPGYVL